MQRTFVLLVLLVGGWGCAERDTLSGERVTMEDLTVAVKRRLEADPRFRRVRRGGPGQLLADQAEEGTHSVMLDNLLLELSDNPAERGRQVDEFLARVTAAREASSPAQRERILPAIKTLEFLRQMEAVAGLEDPIVSRPLSGDLVVVYAIDAPTTMAYVAWSQLPGMGVRADEIESLALANFRREKLAGLGYQQRGPFVFLGRDGDYDATFLLFPEVWDAIAEQLGRAPVVAVPARGQVCFVASGSGLEAELARWAWAIHGEAPHPMSTLLYEWRDGTWNVLPR